VAQGSKADLVYMRIEHVSGLLRLEWLKELFARHRAGEVSEEELRAGEDQAIREVIAKQEAAGYPVVTDGEYRCFVFSESATDSLAGLAAAPPRVEEEGETVKPGARFESAPEEQQMARYRASEVATPENRWRGENVTGWRNPAFDQLVDAFNVTLDPNERIQQRVQMAKLMSDEVPAIMLTENPNMHANLATVKNVTPRPPWPATGRITWNIHQWELASP
jgi:hypothetical protein